MAEMLLHNTGNNGKFVPIGQAILDGYAPNDELYVPEEFPLLSENELYSLKGASYSEIFYEVTKKFLAGALPDDELKQIAVDVYNPDSFDFDDGRLRLTQTPSGIYIVGLSDGPTGAFKDMAMQPFAKLVEAISKHKGIHEQLDILVSTSGDTGPAAQHAFRDIDGVRTITMFPAAGTSEFQCAQMLNAHDGEKVHSIEVEADFTQINDMHMLANREFELGAVNSVNIARLIAQIPYHVSAYLQAIEASNKYIGDPVDVSIPSGNLGNGLAAVIARKMGVPLRNIILAANENDILTRYIQNREYPHLPEKSEIHTTSSAQDIRNPSNWWRLAHMVYGGRNSEIYEEWHQTGAVVDLGRFPIKQPDLLRNLKSTTVTTLARHAMMWTVWEDSHNRLMIDPHTANAVVGATEFRKEHEGIPMVAYETAKPFKFPEVMKFVLGSAPEVSDRFSDVMRSTDKAVPHADTYEDIRAYLTGIGVKRK